MLTTVQALTLPVGLCKRAQLKGFRFKTLAGLFVGHKLHVRVCNQSGEHQVFSRP